MGSDIAVRVHSIKKDFHLPHHSSDSIKDSIVHMFQKKEKGSDTFHALKGVSFDIKKGEFFGILGRNGSGKSTLLKIISEIYQPTSGSVSHKGNLVAFIELGVGFKPQLTGRENVYLNGALLGFSKKEIDERYDEIVAFAELEDFMEQKLKNYSSGMKVRLAFAVAIQAQSDILVLDEVLAVGDASFQRKCYDYFNSLKRDKSKTIIFVTHSMNAVREYCDRAVLIEKGVVAYQGEADMVADEYTKLFSTAKTETDKNIVKSSDGSSQFSFVEASATKNRITLRLGVMAHEDLNHVHIGIAITKEYGGRILAGTNTYVLDGEYFSMKAGEKKEFSFEFKNTFGPPNLSVNVYLKSDKGTVERASWENAVSIMNPSRAGFPVYLQPIADQKG